MIGDLSLTLKALLQAHERPELVRNAEVAFDAPGDTYNPSAATINLFLYDVRENRLLRSNVAEWDRVSSEIRPPAYRLACSYLVTAWAGAALSGEDAILAQHSLLGEVARALSCTTEIALAGQPYPVPLTLSHLEPSDNPGQFWSALGGKLRPSFTLTATVALMPHAEPVTAYQVSTRRIDLQGAEPVHQIGGSVADASGEPLDAVELSLLELGLQATSGRDGRFALAGVPQGTYQLVARKPGYAATTLQVQVPGPSPTAFDLRLTPH